MGISMEKNKNVVKSSSSAGEVVGQAESRAEVSHLRSKHHDQQAAQPGFCWVTFFLSQQPVFLGAHFKQDKILTDSCKSLAKGL